METRRRGQNSAPSEVTFGRNVLICSNLSYLNCFEKNRSFIAYLDLPSASIDRALQAALVIYRDIIGEEGLQYARRRRWSGSSRSRPSLTAMIDYAREDTEIPVFAVGVYLSFIFQLPDFLPQPSC